MSTESEWVGILPTIDTSQLVGRGEVARILGLKGPASTGHWGRHELFPAPVVVVPLPGHDPDRAVRWWSRAEVEAFAELRPTLLHQIMAEASQKRIKTVRERGGTFSHPRRRKIRKNAVKIRVSNLPNVENPEQ